MVKKDTNVTHVERFTQLHFFNFLYRDNVWTKEFLQGNYITFNYKTSLCLEVDLLSMIYINDKVPDVLFNFILTRSPFKKEREVMACNSSGNTKCLQFWIKLDLPSQLMINIGLNFTPSRIPVRINYWTTVGLCIASDVIIFWVNMTKIPLHSIISFTLVLFLC